MEERAAARLHQDSSPNSAQIALMALGRGRDKGGAGVGFDYGEKEGMQRC
jgi:hypothetical protein